MATLAAQFVPLFPPPIRPDTVGGYVEFRGFHPLAILFAVWALASATGFVRGDEELGTVEAALATGTSRVALIASRVAGFAIAITVASAAAGAGFVFGVALGHETVETQRVIEASLLLAAIGLACYALSLLAAQVAGASAAPWWKVSVVRGLYERRLGLLAWCAGMAVLAAVFVTLTRTIVQVLLSIPTLLPYLSIFVHQQLYPAVLGYTWFNVAQLLFAALAITYVARWSAEDTDGRLEILLSQPQSRAAIVLERMTVLADRAVLIAAVSGAVLYSAS